MAVQPKIRWIGTFSDHGSYATDFDGELFTSVLDARQKLEERYRHGYWRRCPRINAPDGEETADLMPAVSEEATIMLWKITPERLDHYVERMKDDDAEPHRLGDSSEAEWVVVIGERSQNGVAYTPSEYLDIVTRREERRNRAANDTANTLDLG